MATAVACESHSGRRAIVDSISSFQLSSDLKGCASAGDMWCLGALLVELVSGAPLQVPPPSPAAGGRTAPLDERQRSLHLFLDALLTRVSALLCFVAYPLSRVHRLGGSIYLSDDSTLKLGCVFR